MFGATPPFSTELKSGKGLNKDFSGFWKKDKAGNHSLPLLFNFSGSYLHSTWQVSGASNQLCVLLIITFALPPLLVQSATASPHPVPSAF